MIGPVAVHDGQPLGAVILGTGLGDIGDTAVEERAFAGQPGIDQIRAFVRGAPPVCGLHHPALAHQFLLQRHVIQVATHRQAIVAPAADVTVHQHLRPAVRPGRPVGCGYFREAGLWQRIGPGRLEQPVIAQVGGDDPRQFLTQRRGTRCIGRRGDIAIGRKARDGNAEIVEIALETDRTGQALTFVDCLDLASFRKRLTQILLVLGVEGGYHQRDGGEQNILHWANLQSKSTVMSFHAS